MTDMKLYDLDSKALIIVEKCHKDKLYYASNSDSAISNGDVVIRKWTNTIRSVFDNKIHHVEHYQIGMWKDGEVYTDPNHTYSQFDEICDKSLNKFTEWRKCIIQDANDAAADEFINPLWLEWN